MKLYKVEMYTLSANFYIKKANYSMQSKSLIFCVIAFVSACSVAFSIQPEKSTDNLLREHLQSIPIQPFQELFNKIKIHSFLEFGINNNTQYFLNNCSTVTSCEIILPHQTDAWVKKNHKPFKKHKNWTSILKKGSWNLYNAHIIASKTQKDPSLFDSAYLLDIKEICEMLFKDNSFEMVFVSPSFPMKGDLINELFDHVPIIATYQTDSSIDLCDWDKIRTPSNYEKIIFTQERGITFWVHKDKTDVIKILCKNSSPQDKTLQIKNLRIFFPQMHPVLVQSMALTLQYLGHTLVLPGESFDPKSSSSGLKISYGTFFKKNPLDSVSYTQFFSESSESCNFLKHNVEVIENDELLTHPPDVLCVNCLEVENSMYKIWKYFHKNHQTPPKLVHYSGNNHSRYKSKYVKNLIAVDAFTASYFDRNKTNIIFWIPWIDFERFKFEDFDDSSVINSYIAHQHQHKCFQSSAEIFNSITGKIKMDFPMVEIHSYPNQASPSGYFPHNQASSLFNKSSATLHIKETEGFGYTIIQSLAKGRPVFLKRSFSLGSRMMNWCIEGRTAFFFDDYSELQQKLHRYLNDREYRHQVQNDCAQIIRKIINNEKQARILDNFLQNLQ